MQERVNFGSKFGIIAAVAGSAIGLGNIWKFPYLAGENGGGAFILVYLLCVAVIGVPIMMSEFVIGRKGQKNAFGSFKAIAPGTKWYMAGFMGVVAAFFILSFYSAVAGWTLEYVVLSLTNQFANQTPEQVTATFQAFIQNPVRPIVWQMLFLLLTAIIVWAGVRKGIEKYTKILMPLLLLLILVLCVRSITLPGGVGGLAFLFKPDFSKITGTTLLNALGQAFFSLSLGMGTLITYSSYFGKSVKLGEIAVKVSFADTMIAILAGIAIFPAVFAFGIEPSAGPGLVFLTLPGIFQQMPGGNIFGAFFFILLGVAALTSTISILEVIVAFFSEELRISRRRATAISVASVAVLGTLASLSFSSLAHFKIFGKTVFDLLDYSSTNILLPLGGLAIVIFLGWYLKGNVSRQELSNGGTLRVIFFPLFHFIIKFLAPVAIAAILIYSILYGGIG